MQLRLPHCLLLPLFVAGLFLLSCDKDLTSSEDQPLVDYIVIVTDSATGGALDDVRIRVTSIGGDTASYFTDAVEGRAELETVASSRTLFVISKPGYRTLDILDTVNAKPDSVFHRPIQRLLRAKLVDLDPDRNRVQVNILLRDEELRRIRGGVVTLTDSLGTERPFSDNDTDGTIALSGLKAGKNAIRVEKSGYLGRLTEVGWAKAADSGAGPEAVTIRLLPLDNSISGQVYYKTSGGSKPLLDAKVEFHLKDSMAVPSVFRTFTGAEVGQNGAFNLAKVPALDGELWFFKNRTSTERTKIVPLTQEEVLLDGPLPMVTLTVAADSLLPLLVAGPDSGLPGNDSLEAKDSLVFRFNQKVEEVKALSVRLVNGSELLINSSWDAGRTVLKVWQKDEPWTVGMKYEYLLDLRNGLGEAFSVPGDSARVVAGAFAVRAKPDGRDTSVAYPRGIHLAYFNSGDHHQYGRADTLSSPEADSTSEFARLKWRWDAKGRRPDSLIVYFQDNRTHPFWSRWAALPGFLDSANLAFSDKYSTVRAAGQRARFPLRDSGGSVTFRMIPKDAGEEVDGEDTTLEATVQGMGPTVYAFFNKAGASDSAGVQDTVKVTFRRRIDNSSTEVVWGAGAPVPEVSDDAGVANTLTWKWDADGKTGLLIYTLPGFVPKAPRFRVNLNGKPYQGKPVWQRNVNDVLVLE
jgi:hypothetical protein